MDDRSQRIERRFDGPMIVVALMVIPAVVIDASSPAAPWPDIGMTLNVVCWLAFFFEWALMMSVVPDRRAWLRDHKLETLIVFVTVPVPFVGSGVAAIRLLRLSRLLRLAWVAKRLRGALTIEGLPYVALVAFLAVIASGALYSFAEDHHRKQSIGLWDGIWWAATTVTTVGYGDLAPVTVWGKVLALTVMLIGIGFVAILTGAVAQHFLTASNTKLTEESHRDDLLLELRQINDRLRLLEGSTVKRGDVAEIEPVQAE